MKKSTNFTMGTMVYDNKGLHDNTTLISINVYLINQKICDDTVMQKGSLLAIIPFSIINQSTAETVLIIYF